MRTVLTKFLAFSSIALLMLASCKKDETKVVATSGKGGALQASATTIVLTKANIANTAVTFTSTLADFGYKAAITNVLQIDVASDNWAKPKEYTMSAGALSQSFSVPDFNALLLALNLPTGTASQVQARIKSQISANSAPVYSNVLALSVTPFALISYVWVPGEYQNTDASTKKQWQPATADSLVSPTGNGVYTGYVHFYTASSNFKVTPANNWNASYGDAGSGKISLTGGNIVSPKTPGLYLVTVDLNANTIAFASADHLWSVIGDGDIDWNTDIDMAFNQNANVYQVTTALNSTGHIKFRADHAWALSLGDVAPVTGQLTSNSGGNIAIPSNGNYLVTLSYGDPLLGPTYKLVKQ
jgi:hypothetical protein